MSKIVLVIAAHTDDEALGCGGTIARHVAEGDTVHAVFLADGVSSRVDASELEMSRREKAAIEAHEILSLKSVEYLNLPDNRLDTVPLLDVVQLLEGVVERICPNIVYTHHFGDLNVDHQITHRAAMTSCRPLPGSSIEEIYSFEIISSTEWNSPGVNTFVPTVHVDISAYIERKFAALTAYDYEMRNMPHSRSVEHVRALATRRGHSVGLELAESFMLMRTIR